MTQLAEFARHEFRLSKVGKDGKSLRETLQSVEKMIGRMPEEGINPIEFPEVFYDLWQWFLKLNLSRPDGAMPISEQEIGWFFRNRRITPEGWQIDVIRILDNIALER